MSERPDSLALLYRFAFFAVATGAAVAFATMGRTGFAVCFSVIAFLIVTDLD